LKSTSISVSETKRALLDPDEALRFPPTKLIIMPSGFAPVLADKIRYFEDRTWLAAAKMPAPERSDRIRELHAGLGTGKGIVVAPPAPAEQAPTKVLRMEDIMVISDDDYDVAAQAAPSVEDILKSGGLDEFFPDDDAVDASQAEPAQSPRDGWTDPDTGEILSEAPSVEVVADPFDSAAPAVPAAPEHNFFEDEVEATPAPSNADEFFD
jgi:hypothetical protein